ncbi:hypothetical protein, partial [Bradyrhizobium sp.]|uniref:hypothetical protein n=1 Tax=Bradyrhizobium sp. TaxID=376 RepID=UPI002E052CBA|nr:hypothetical protein [Bradyrhizobium sp.]
MERLTARLTDDDIRQMPPLSAPDRAALRARYQQVQTPAPSQPKRKPRSYISHALADRAHDLVEKLTGEINTRVGEGAVFWDQLVALGEEWEPRLREEMKRADTLIVVAGDAWGHTDWTT